MSLDFGVFYTCYTEIESVRHSIEKLRDIYKTVPVYLVSDGGADYSFLKEKFDNLEAFLEHDSRGFIPFLTKETYKLQENQDQIKQSIMTLLDRMNRAADFCNKELLLVMEPDVLVRGHLAFFPDDAHLLGSRVNEGLSDELRLVVKSVHGSIDVNSWGATPAFFRVSTFKKAYDLMKNDELLSKLALADHRLANYDVLMAVMFALVGAPEVFNPELIECFRSPNWKSTWHPLVHQYREKYPKSTAGYTGFHTRHKDGIGDVVK